MPVLYPENSQRASRLGQLADDVTESQSEIADKYEIVSGYDIDARQYLNKYLSLCGATTFDQLEAKALASMSPDQLEIYQKMKSDYQSWADKVDTAVDVSSIIFLSAFTYNLAFDFTAFYTTVGVARVARVYMFGFKTILTDGLKAGVDILKAADRGAEACVDTLGALNKFTGYLWFLREVSRIVIGLGAVADAALLFYEGYEGWKQKPKFIEGIHNLQINRLVCGYIQRVADSTVSIYSSLTSFAERLAKYGPDDPTLQEDILTLAEDITRIEFRTSLLAVEFSNERKDAGRAHYADDDLPRDAVLAGAVGAVDLTSFTVFPGVYKIVNAMTGNLMDQAWLQKTNGTPIIGHADNGGDNQKWIVSPTGNAVFTLKNVFAGSYASPVQTSNTEVPSVQANSEIVDWWIKPGTKPDLFIIQANILDSEDPLAGKVMELQDGSILDSTLVVLRDLRTDDALSQQWRFQDINPSPVEDGTYFVNNAQYTSVLWDQWWAATADGTPINANGLNSNPNQQWTFKAYGNGVYTIVNGNGTYASFIQTNQPGPDGTLQANAEPTYWKVSQGVKGGNYYIQAVDPTVKTSLGGTVLGLTAGKIGTSITLKTQQSPAILSQQWTLRKV